MYLGVRPKSHLAPSRHEGRGVTVNDESGVQPGHTLLAGLFDDSGSSVRLIANDGDVLKHWPTSYSKIWPDPKHIEDIPFNDWFADIHGLVLLPDQSIVFNYEFLGLVRLDTCGDVIWKIPQETHHAVFLAEDDTIWVPSRKFHTVAPKEFPNILAPFYEDTILQISLDGEILQEVSILGLIYENKMEGLLPTGESDTTLKYFDPLHVNDVEVLSSQRAAAFDSLSAGVVMVSMRVPNLVLIFDPKTEEILWHQTGPWLRQHDPDFRDDGLISIFDNRGSGGDEKTFGGSRMVVVDPMTRRTREAFPHRAENRFFTPSRGKHQNLANGNILLVETARGRVLEVTEDGKIVWSYLNRYDENTVGKIQVAVRYSENYLDEEPKAWSELPQ